MVALIKPQRRQVLESFAREYGGAFERSRIKLLITPGESEKSFPVTVLGALSSRRYLIVSAPQTQDGSLIAVFKGLSLSCRWFNASSAFIFEGIITKIAFEPEPLLYLRLADRTSRRAIRTVPRALVNLPGALRTPEMLTSLVVDLSVTGARIALVRDAVLQAGQELELSIKPRMMERDFLLTLNCTVATAPEAGPPGYPDIAFYGLKFHDLADTDLLMLHAYVQQCLVNETDALAHVLLGATEIVELHE